MKKVALVACTLLCLGGCAAGSATAGYSAVAGKADELGSEERARIINEAVARSDAHTNAEIARLRAELGR
jgi:hypothetical protein